MALRIGIATNRQVVTLCTDPQNMIGMLGGDHVVYFAARVFQLAREIEIADKKIQL